jgi:hypothetical protein
LLQRLQDEAPVDHFSLAWLMGSLRKRSFGVIMLLFALVAIAPGVSIAAGLLLIVPAFQMIAGRPAPSFIFEDVGFILKPARAAYPDMYSDRN